MAHSIFDLFKIGIGPSSSHTVGPMVAGNRFITLLEQHDLLSQVTRVNVSLYGSLALTGKGHATDTACILGLMAQSPETVNADDVPTMLSTVAQEKTLMLGATHPIYFESQQNIIFHFDKFLPQHSNGMVIEAYSDQQLLLKQTYFSVGGGFVQCEKELGQSQEPSTTLPYPFDSARELLAHCEKNDMRISEVVLANEHALGTLDITGKVNQLWQVMHKCIERGITTDGILPGELKLKRRAYDMHQRLLSLDPQDQFDTLDWVNLFAMAVNEENAAGGRVVTAPTNGAAGVIPAVIAWFLKFKSNDDERGIREFMITAAAVGLLYKKNASISAAEVGCQGEIGVACSMAAAGLTAAMGGTPQQIENAAEIGMEHNLGLTCDPINGLVQVPCIERNTMGALKAINASRLAMQSDGIHHVHLDDVIKTMHQTGLDMMSKYKETSQGGLAINVIAC
mgnify:FL=1